MKLKKLATWARNIFGKYYLCKLSGKHERGVKVSSMTFSDGITSNLYRCPRCYDIWERKVRAAKSKKP